MTSRAWRIVKKNHADHAFDGEGTRRYGSRWTSPGISVAFASETLSLAVLEVLVHLQSAEPLTDYVTFAIDYSENLVEELDMAKVPRDCRDFPAPPALKALGNEWVRRASSVMLRVPSAVVAKEHNLVINPAHADFAKLHLKGPAPLDVDSRVFRRAT